MAAFKEWARNESLETSGSLEQFRNSRIALDAEDYLSSLLTTTLTREPLLPALGGLPFALQKHVDDDLQNFRDAGITPLFVFNGLELASKDKAMTLREARRSAKILEDAWSIYDLGRGDDAVVAFGKACTYKTDHISRWLHAYLHKESIFVQTATYTAAAQLVYMEQNGYADALAGSASCLVFGAEKVITNFAWDSSSISWVESKTCQGKLLLNVDGFNDLMLLAGCTNILPALADLENEPARIQACRRLLTTVSGDGHALCLQHKDEDYLNAFRKARYAIKHPVLLTGDGKVEPKGAEKGEKSLPNDVHEFTGQRLPDELYFYLSRGLAGPRILNWYTSNQLIETPPLDGGNSQAYRDLVQNKLLDLRTQSLAVIAALLHRYYKNKPSVDVVFWFTDDKRPISIKEIADPMPKAATWHVKEEMLPAGMMKAQPLATAIGMLSDEQIAKSTHTPKDKDTPAVLSKPLEVLGNTVFRFLHDRGYVNADHTLSAWGKALKTALDHAHGSGFASLAVTDTEAEEAIFMAFELLRLKIVGSQQMFATPPFSGQPLRGSDTDKAHTLLISRIACLGLFRHRAIGYTGPLSRHLLAYHQMTAAVRASLRDLLEMHACTLLMTGAVDRAMKPEDLTDIGTGLPFVREPDLGLALVVKSYLDELSNESSRRADITKWFNYVEDINGDLEKAWKLWAAVNTGVQTADSSILTAEKKVFKTADEWLQKKRDPTKFTNGVTA